MWWREMLAMVLSGFLIGFSVGMLAQQASWVRAGERDSMIVVDGKKYNVIRVYEVGHDSK